MWRGWGWAYQRGGAGREVVTEKEGGVLRHSGLIKAEYWILSTQRGRGLSIEAERILAGVNGFPKLGALQMDIRVPFISSIP